VAALVIGWVLLFLGGLVFVAFVGGVAANDPDVTDGAAGFVIFSVVLLVPGFYLVRWARRRRGPLRTVPRTIIIVLLTVAGFLGLVMLISVMAAASGSIAGRLPRNAVGITMVIIILLFLTPLYLMLSAFYPREIVRKEKTGLGRWAGSIADSTILWLSQHERFLWFAYIGFVLTLWTAAIAMINLTDS
jgi:hypothetical protein